jgi:hypothetical protein
MAMAGKIFCGSGTISVCGELILIYSYAGDLCIRSSREKTMKKDDKGPLERSVKFGLQFFGN